MANVLFTNVRILDGAAGQPYAGEVLVQGNRIARIARGTRALPVAGVTTIDGAGATLMTGMVEAIGPLNSAGECNDGFVRDDAILVVTVISDDHSGWFGNDNENGYGGTPESWYADVIAVKGKPENVVVLSLVALLDDQSCIGFGPEESDQFIAFTEMFGAHGIVASVCEQDYNQFFQSAVGLIDTTCDEFEPEG